MPIGTVYRPPPRKRSSTGLVADTTAPANSATASTPPPPSPSLPTGRGKSDLEARIAEFSTSTTNPTTAVLSPDTNPLSPSSALPPKSPVGANSIHHRSRPSSAPISSNPPQSIPPPIQTSQSSTNTSSIPDPPSAAAQPYPPPSHNPHTQHTGATTLPTNPRDPVDPAARDSQNNNNSTSNNTKAAKNTSDMGKQSETGGQVSGPAKVLILYYSMYGHVRLLADSVRQGVESVQGCTAEIYRVPETLSKDVLKKMNAPPKHEDPVLTHDLLHKLGDAEGVMFGIPTRFGMMPAQMKAMFDSTVKLWTKGDLVGKPAGLFFSSATQGGGQETTALTTITQLVHHGMIYVPPGYSFGGAMFDNSEVHGGSPYGCGTIANGDGSRLPTKYELDFARHQGAQFALVAQKLAQ